MKAPVDSIEARGLKRVDGHNLCFYFGRGDALELGSGLGRTVLRACECQHWGRFSLRDLLKAPVDIIVARGC